MRPLKLTLKTAPAQRVDFSPATPNQLQGMRPAAIARIPLQSGNRKVTIGELFTLAGDDTQHLQLRGDLGKFDGIGSGMSSGLMTVHGRVGDRLGSAIRGGQITVYGDTRDWLGAEMRGGQIEVHGHAGDRVGAAYPGDAHGMDGGTIIITGNAGMRVGDRMRRGIIVIKGNAGDYCGARILAGTILVFGTAGNFSGLGMKRGTIILGRMPKQIATSFNSSGILKMQFLRILFRQLAHLYPNLEELKRHGPICERYCGDLAIDGKGELIILRASYPY
jgi:formylmethanofuran dehydrogenase subunit C